MRDILKSHYKSFSKFTVVGVVNTVIDFSVFFILHSLFGVIPVVAHISAFCIALANSFYFNAIWTFKNLKRDQLRKQVTAFVIIGVLGLVLSTPVLYFGNIFLTSVFGEHALWTYGAKVIAMVVSLIWNYVGSWIFVFKD